MATTVTRVLMYGEQSLGGFWPNASEGEQGQVGPQGVGSGHHVAGGPYCSRAAYNKAFLPWEHGVVFGVLQRHGLSGREHCEGQASCMKRAC